MNSIDNERVRALLLYRTRRALAGNDAMRWDRIASAILSVAASARLLRDVADFAQSTRNPQAIEAGRSVEAAIVNAIGVDLLAAITREGQPIVREGDPVYVLPAGPGRQMRPAWVHLNNRGDWWVGGGGGGGPLGKRLVYPCTIPPGVRIPKGRVEP